jgi:hypothetical protein
MARKKTRKEKVAAAKRRVREPLTSPAQNQKLSFDDSILGKVTVEKSPKKEIKTNEVLSSYNTGYFFVDLRKTLILTFVVIATEVGLYLVLK